MIVLVVSLCFLYSHRGMGSCCDMTTLKVDFVF